jgi:mercuric ion transport protein
MMEHVEKDFPGPLAISREAREAVRPIAKAGLVAAGGILGALAASACCIVPLVLFTLGISGAWIGNLTTLAPYQPYSLAVTGGFLGVGYYLV